MKRTTFLAFLAAASMSVACSKDSSSGGSGEDDDNAESGDTTGGQSTTAGPTTASTTITPTDESGGTTGGTDPSAGEGQDSLGFIGDMGGPISVECDVWAQDCDKGQKCAPYSVDGQPTWNGTKCVDVADEPGTAGDPCMDPPGAPSGEDSCDRSHICWNVDQETGQGTCIAFCSGSQESPVCDDPTTTCSITNDGVLILCLPKCDPLLQNCTEGEACYPIPGEQYACAPDITDGMGVFGEVCSALNGCAPGFFCGDAQFIPGCTEAACCNAYCDQEGANNCPGMDQECVAMFENPPPGFENVGACSLPTG